MQPRESTSVSRRGICDRAIWRKPLARRTRCSYGFCVRDSRFVRRRVGLSGLVKDVGKSVGRSEEAIFPAEKEVLFLLTAPLLAIGEMFLLYILFGISGFPLKPTQSHNGPP